ncbi:MAG: sigma 54-interacting transcriptional regulator [Oligoflexia bacterium]|nr:sigma 54-interacting transcriptional regulator [Oligoflexia bacterium]
MPDQPASLESQPPYRFHRLIGSHPLMMHLYELIGLVAPTDVTVHIYGESGVGKELVADAIHHLSGRRAGRFAKVNCSTIPHNLLESTLFGHVKGAFTDAHRDQQGIVEYAHDGTIFLDEIGDVSPDMQVKLLRLLQSHEYSRVGEALTRKADIRIITATNRHLEDLVARGRIREDFYYRINVFPLRIPPLRNRSQDILALSSYFISKFNQRFSKSITGLSDEVAKLFEQYQWPGNVRELENALEHAFVIAKSGAIEMQHLPDLLSHSDPAGLSQRVERQHYRSSHAIPVEEEKLAILDALEASDGNKTKAAAMLGFSRVTLWKKLNRYGLANHNSKMEH